MRLPKTDKTNHSLLCVLTTLLATLGLNAQSVQRSPLVLGIIVEGLQDDYLRLLEPQLTEGGFKRLMNKGLSISSIDFGPGLDPTAAAAVIYTGAAPMVNGIPAELIYTPATNLTTKVLVDPKCIGNFTDETFSAKAIKVSTLADEFRIDTEGDGMVYAIGADPQMALVAAGHAANGAYWIYDHTGNWASTTYYKEMPASVSNRNYLTPLHSRLDTIKWVPSRPLDSYPLISRGERNRPFRHTYPSKQFDRFTRFKNTPPGNTEVTDLALDLMSTAKMGRDENPDMLNIVYTLSLPGATRLETIDAYLRLDRDLARLFSTADRVSSAGAPTIFLAGTPSRGGMSPDDPKWRVPTGEYSIKKAMSLLEMYLMATHGNGDWVTGYNNRQFFLNRKYITDRGLSLSDFRTEVADFLARMAGVSNVFTIDDIIAARVGDDPQALKRNISVEHCGDVIVEVNPGWVIVDDNNPTPNSRRPAERNNAASIPAFIMGPNVSATKIETPVDARAIAPTVAHTIRIRAPNASSVPPVRTN